MIPEETAGRFTFRLGRVSRSRGEDVYRLVVGDETSRLQIVELSLTAQQFAEAVTGLQVGDIEGTLIAGSARNHLGRRMEHYSVTLPRGLSEEACREWADRANVPLHADAVEMTSTRDGMRVTFRWYTPVHSKPIDMKRAERMLPAIPERP